MDEVDGGSDFWRVNTMTTEQQTSLDELEKSLWETADSLRNESSLTSQMYYMPVLGIIFLRHATFRFRLIEKKLKESKNWPCRNGVPRPVRADDFIKESPCSYRRMRGTTI